MIDEILNEDQIYYRGTIFTISYLGDIQERESFLLTECFEDEYVFQIICISGYGAGTVQGYIKKGVLARTHRAITHEELIEGIKYNFLNPDFDSLKIEDEYNIKFE